MEQLLQDPPYAPEDDDDDMYSDDMNAEPEEDGEEEEAGKPDAAMPDEGTKPAPPVHRYRSKGSIDSTRSDSKVSLASLNPSDSSPFQMPDMTDEQKQELALVLQQIRDMQLEPMPQGLYEVLSLYSFLL